MTSEHLDLDILVEGEEIEAKQAQGRDGSGAVPRSLWDTYSAFANTRGGYLLLGAREKPDGYFDYLGISKPEKLIRDFWSEANDQNIISRNLLSSDDVYVVEHNGVQIVIVRVPRARREQRPVYKGNDPFAGTYKRLDEGDYRCSRDEVQRMFAEAASRPPSDAVVPDYTLDDLEMESIARFRRRLRDVRPDHPFLDGDDEQLLLNLRVLERDRATQEVGVTLAGLLMFGKSLSIRERLPHHHLDYQERSVNEERWSHRIHSDGTWSGNLYDFYTKVIGRLHDGLDVPFRVVGDRRIDDTPVHEALREALANTLIHADHEATTGIVIEKWPDKYIFKNPGRLRVPLQSVYEGGHSDPRNPILHQVFIAPGIAERAGSGVPKILRAWRNQHWRRPELREDLETERTQLTLHLATLLPEDAVRRVEELIGADDFRQLSHEQRVILVTACEDGETTHEQLKPLIDVHPRDLTLALQKLVDQGHLIRHGTRRGSSYSLRARETHEQLSVTMKSQGLGESSQGLEESSQGSDESSQGLEESSQGLDEATSSWDTLVECAERIRTRKRVSKTLMREMILMLCEIQPLTTSELSTLLGRSRDYLQNEHLGALIKSGELVYGGAAPTSPDQTYTVP